MYLERYFSLGKKIGLVVILYFICRVYFFISNYTTFQEADFYSLVLAFIHGERFDLSIIFSSNLLFIVLYVNPVYCFKSEKAQLFLKYLFLLINLPLLFMNLADVEFFKFTAKRTGYDILGILGDVKNQLGQLVFYYWYVFLFVTLLGFLLHKLYGGYVLHTKMYKSKITSWVFFSLTILFSVLIIRGGVQYKPLKPDHAFVHSPNVLGNLVLNTPYNFFTTLSFPNVEKLNYFPSDSIAKSFIKMNENFTISTIGRQNVVIVILESFSREYMGLKNPYKGYTPFLDSLCQQGVFFDHHYSNGRRSIEAVPSIFASIPSLTDEAYITGPYQTNEIKGLPGLLRIEGYYTAFFHGGENGTMGFDKFCINAGFQDYFGLNEYPDKNDFDGHWGIYDGPYLNYFSQKLSSFKQPFMASVFTLSSHQPYSVPKEFKGVFPKGTLPIHESVGYADDALRQFFKTASQQSWYANTLFIVTADHTQELMTPAYKNILGHYRVPLLFFHPSKVIDLDTSKVSQHADIMPTVLGLLGVKNEKTILFGSPLVKNGDGSALYYTNKRHVYVKGNYYIIYYEGKGELYSILDLESKSPVLDKPEIKEKMEVEVRAYLQYYNNGLIYNSWYR